MAYVRSEAKGHGTGARIEGRVAEGDEVIVVEDLISTGGSALDAVATLRAHGAVVRAVLAIFSYRLDAAAHAFAQAEVPGHVLTDFHALTAVAHEQERLSDAEREALETWRADPAAWSQAHGGAAP
jgi:orotate phosphoribosyltransferase